METKETLQKSLTDKSILENSDYYKYIFKKTEKIACAVFYILRSDKSIRADDVVVKDLEATARVLLDTALLSLRGTARTLTESAQAIRHDYIVLEAKLHVAHAARLLSAELLAVFVHEIDSVQRSLRKYTESHVEHPLLDTRTPFSDMGTERRMPRAKSREFEGTKSIQSALPVATPSRKERVLDVIREKGQATIKDISEVIKDCSEKTIQRELVDLITDNVIVRFGERRWSKYKLV